MFISAFTSNKKQLDNSCSSSHSYSYSGSYSDSYSDSYSHTFQHDIASTTIKNDTKQAPKSNFQQQSKKENILIVSTLRRLGLIKHEYDLKGGKQRCFLDICFILFYICLIFTRKLYLWYCLLILHLSVQVWNSIQNAARKGTYWYSLLMTISRWKFRQCKFSKT